MAELSQKMKELVQPYLASIEPYDPNFTPTRINLSANENTYPVPEGVREAVDAAPAVVETETVVATEVVDEEAPVSEAE